MADHILDGGRLASRALPSCLDFQNLPNNDKEKVINCDQNYLFASILCPIQCCRVHKKKYSNCVHVVVADLGGLKRIIHDKFYALFDFSPAK